MDVTLKKSADLQVAIRAEINAMSMRSTVGISIFSTSVEHDIATATASWRREISRRETLLDTLYELREKTGAANAASGIDALLTRAARVKSDIDFLAPVVGGGDQEMPEIIAGKIERLKREVPVQSRGFGHQEPADTVSVSLLDQEMRQMFVEELRARRKEAQSIKDMLLEKNFTTRFKLSEKAEQALSEAGLV